MQELTQEYLKSVLDYDPLTGVFTWKKGLKNNPYSGKQAGSKHNQGYLCIRIMRKSYLSHRLAWFYIHNEWHDQIDHKDTIRNNNWISNLRPATNQTNNNNRIKCHKNNLSGLLGVSFCKIMSKYVSRIMVDGKTIRIGYFDDKESAHKAYIEKKRILHDGCTL